MKSGSGSGSGTTLNSGLCAGCRYRFYVRRDRLQLDRDYRLRHGHGFRHGLGYKSGWFWLGQCRFRDGLRRETIIG